MSEKDELMQKIQDLEAELAQYRWATGQINRAISNKGTNPSLHDSVYSRHRSEWAVLWKALDNLVEIYEGT